MNNFHFFPFRAETELHILYLKQIGDDESNSCSILHQRRHWWHRRERSLPQRCRISPAVRRAAYHHLLNNGKCTEREWTNVWRSLLCRSEMNEAVLSLRSVAGFQPRSSTAPPPAVSHAAPLQRELLMHAERGESRQVHFGSTELKVISNIERSSLNWPPSYPRRRLFIVGMKSDSEQLRKYENPHKYKYEAE